MTFSTFFNKPDAAKRSGENGDVVPKSTTLDKKGLKAVLDSFPEIKGLHFIKEIFNNKV